MACFHPLEAVQDHGGGRVTVKEGSHGQVRGIRLWLPCGRCIGCRAAKRRAWAVRCMHEAQMHRRPSSFVTLTYKEAPVGLEYHDYQLFMLRLRRRYGNTRFFACGEYGEKFGRVHWHALLFGLAFSDLSPLRDGLSRSAELERLWPFGHSSVGTVTFQSASYVAGYCVSRRGSTRERVDLSTGEIHTVRSEFARMSLKPHGIGYSWFQAFWPEVFKARDGVTLLGGRVVPPPRYYFNLLQALPEDSEGELSGVIKADRLRRAAQFAGECCPSRLEVRERCALAKERFLKSNRGEL